MGELERKKLENSQNLEFVRTYLAKTNLSGEIAKHPRFDTILWKISALMQRVGVKAFSSEAVSLLSSNLIIVKDGSVVIVEDANQKDFVASTKYYFDESDATLKRIVCGKNNDESEMTSISTYDDDGIEQGLLISQKCVDGSKFYSNSNRVPGRIDMIRIQRILEKNGERKTLADVLQIRTFCVAYEDIYPSADDIDPLDFIHLSFLGVPPIYRDLDPEELRIIEDCDGEVFPLDDDNKARQLKDAIDTNKFYGRSRKFEGAIARYLDIEDRLLDGEQL